MKYRPEWVYTAIVIWVIVYLAPGVALGRFVSPYAGLAWMTAGAVLLAIFEWRCLNPRTLSADRDGFRIEGRRAKTFQLTYDRIHEARWEAEGALWRRALGPLVFIEPLWMLQRRGNMRLTIVHGGAPVVLRADEYAGLEEFVEILRKRSVRGLGREDRRPPRPEFPMSGGDRVQPGA